MDYVRKRHGNAVWHLVTGREVCHYKIEDEVVDEFLGYYTQCQPDGYCYEGPRTELITAEHPPGRLCRVCARKSERGQAA